jgi:hypothetical protein
MNNTRTLAAIAAISIIAATLVVGGTFAALTTPQSALAYQKKKVEGDKNSKNGNTITIQKCKQDGTASGFDNDLEQECGNTICTHPGNNASCVNEEEGTVTPTSTSTSTSSPPIPVNTVGCTQTGSTTVTGIAVNNCCVIVQNNNTTGTGGATTGGAQTGTNTCTVTITGPITLPTGTAIPTSAMSLKSSDQRCINGASGSLNTGTGQTFSVCVSV